MLEVSSEGDTLLVEETRGKMENGGWRLEEGVASDV